MEEFLKELDALCEKNGITYTKPIIQEDFHFFNQPSSKTSTIFSETFSNYHAPEKWMETIRESRILFTKKTRAKIR